MATYDALHRQCRTLESLFDTKLTAYSRIASTIPRVQDDVEAGTSTARWKDMELEVEELLEKVGLSSVTLGFSVNHCVCSLGKPTTSSPHSRVTATIHHHSQCYVPSNVIEMFTKTMRESCVGQRCVSLNHILSVLIMPLRPMSKVP